MTIIQQITSGSEILICYCRLH